MWPRSQPRKGAAETETAGVETDPNGCDCRARASRGGWLPLVTLFLLGARRRRRAT
ncbi:MYXO-CTERM sorting domain-containing protein [Paraliomyxa miuraensis]|uniref:MYXO-CTERM sorting domain-containing protein n=1 Tax=Paraliomyxa miuraensis TaxID=376150 RepID=UPI003899DAE3